MKVYVVSLVANCADIIESFVRHSLTFADGMIILDHQSADRTVPILKALQQEGLPLIVRSFDKVEIAHGEVMTDLCWEAVEKYGADIVLPIDADEFLITLKSGCTLRQILEKLSLDKIYEIHHWQYSLTEPDKNKDTYLLARPCLRYADTRPKTFVGREFMRQMPGFQFVQGTHYCFLDIKEHGQVAINSTNIDDYLHLAHYQWRSYEQAISKVINGWITNVARYSVNTVRCGYWGQYFHQLLNGERLNLIDDIKGEEADLSCYAEEAYLRYTGINEDSPLHNLMVLAEQVAHNYAAEKYLRGRDVKLSIIIPDWRDNTKLKFTLNSLCLQNVPQVEVLVYGREEGFAAARGFEWPEDWDIKYVTWNGKIGEVPVGEIVETAASGEYIQWILPGDELLEDALKTMLTSLAADWLTDILLDDDKNGEITDNRKSFGKILDNKKGEYQCLKQNWFRRELLLDGHYPSVGLSGVMFRRRALDDCKWFGDCISDGSFLEITAWWRLVKDDDLIGILCTPFIKADKEKDSPSVVIQSKLEWFFLLEEFGENVLGNRYAEALKSWIDSYDNMNKNTKTEERPEIWEQYEIVSNLVKKRLELIRG